MRYIAIVLQLVSQLATGPARRAGLAVALVPPALVPPVVHRASRPVLPLVPRILPRIARVVAADPGDLFESVADLAKRAGEAAVEAGSRSIGSRGGPGAKDDAAKKGRGLVAVVPEKPLGIAIAANPSGRGTFISEIQPDGIAAKGGKLQVGDFVTGVRGQDASETFQCSWLPVEDVLAAISSAQAPVTLVLRRGGAEPWMFERDQSGLSVEEMVQASRAQYGRLLDAEKEDALRDAFAAIKEGERREAQEAAATGGFESETARAVSRLQYELRSYAQGAREALARVQQFVYNRALLDSRLAVSAAEYILRRALLDTGRILTASSTALAALGAAPDAPRGRAAAAPFERMLGSISGARALRQAPTEQRAGVQAEQEEAAAREADADAREAARQAQLRREAAELLREAIGGVEQWVKQAAEETKDGAGRPDAAEGPDWELLRQRAGLLGGEAAVSLQGALGTLQSDFAAYEKLKQRGQLPTIVEQLYDGELPQIGRGRTLGAFRGQQDPAAQRRERKLRREKELAGKKLGLAAALGERASKDSADAAVYGVLPSAKVLGRRAAVEFAESLAASFGGAPRKGRSKEMMGLMSELASEIAQEYTADLKRGRDYGPLAEVADAVAGPTQKLREDFAAVGQALGSGAQRLLETSDSRIAEQTQIGREKIAELKAQVNRAQDVAAPEPQLLDADIAEVQTVVLDAMPVEGAAVLDAEVVEGPGTAARLVEVVPVEDASLSEVVEVMQPDVGVAVVPLESEAAVGLDDDDVLDVVSEIEADPEEEQQQRDALLTDALLVTAESTIRNVARKVVELFTPADLRPWEPLGSFKKISEADERSRRAEERVLDEFTRRVKRD